MHEPLTQILNFVQIDDRLATAGQPTAAQFSAIHDAGFDTVINLATPASPGAITDEDSIVAANGMHYVAIPVDFKQPQIQDLNKFFTVMQNDDYDKRLVHCAYNWRVSVFVYLYRTLCQGMDVKQAEADLHRIWSPDPVWSEFMVRAATDPDVTVKAHS